MEVITRQIDMNQVDKRLFNQFMLDEDFNVPDSRSDVDKIVSAAGFVKIDEMKPVENYLRVQGKIDFQILYLAEGIEPVFSSLEGKIPFVEMIYVENGAEENMDIQDTRCELQVHMIHSRKLRIKAMVEMNVESTNIRTQDIPTNIACDSKVYTKKEERELLNLKISKKDTYRIKEEITLPGTKESIGMMLWADIENRRTDMKLVVDELQIIGELLVFCFYESPDGKIDWIEQAVPYQGRISCMGIDETMYHHVHTQMDDVRADVRADEDGEMRIIGIEGTLQCHIAVYEEETVEMLEDLYSLEHQCVIEKTETQYETLVLQNQSKCKVMQRLSVPELRNDILQICHSSGNVRIDKMELKDDGILVEGALYINFLYVKANDNMPFDTWQGVVPFSHLMECNDTGGDLRYHISVAVEQLTVTLQGGDEIEVKAALSFRGFFKRCQNGDLIRDVRLEPLNLEEIEKRPSIVGYLVKDGDDLWSLAKRYSTTVDAILDVNEMNSEQLKPGDRLLIFKENMSIL